MTFLQQILLYSNILLWVVQLLVIFCLIVIFRQFGEVYLKSSDSISTNEGLPIGNSIPTFEGEDFRTGNLVTHKDLTGKPTILAFISPYCGSCKDFLPEWNQSYMKYHKKLNFVLMGIGEREEVEEFMKYNEVRGQLIFDRKNKFLQDFRIQVTPFAFILDEKGVIRGKGICNSKNDIEVLLRTIEKSQVKVG